MKVTVTLGSARPGGLDLSMSGLCAQTFQDFEVVFVDGRYHQRHGRVLEYVKASGFSKPFFHVPNHRYQAGPWPTVCAGYNTGFMLASGELTVMLLDYAFAPPDWLAKHVAAHEGGRRLVLAPHIYYDMPPVKTLDGGPPLAKGQATGMTPETIMAERERYDEIEIFRDPPGQTNLGPAYQYPHSDPKLNHGEGPIDHGFFHTKNESFPTESALAANGMDERYDLIRGPGDPELAARLERTGLQVWLARSAEVHCINPRDILPNPNAASGALDNVMPAYPERSTYFDGEAYYFATRCDWNIQRARGNPYDLRTRRAEIWDWREMSQSPELLIPRNEVPNGAYFAAP